MSNTDALTSLLQDKMKEDIDNEVHAERERRRVTREKLKKKAQKQLQTSYAYYETYCEAQKSKRTDAPKINADLHCQVYFLSVQPETTTEKMNMRLDVKDDKFKLMSRKERSKRDKEAKTYDPECQCCQVLFV